MKTSDVLSIICIFSFCILYSAFISVADNQNSSINDTGINGTEEFDCINQSGCISVSDYTVDYLNQTYAGNLTNNGKNFPGNKTEIIEPPGKNSESEPPDLDITPKMTSEPESTSLKSSSSGYDFMAMNEQNKAFFKKNQEDTYSSLSTRAFSGGINVFDAPRPIVLPPGGGCGG